MKFSSAVPVVCALAVFAGSSAAQVVLPNGTKITVRLEQTLSSATAEQGQPVQLAVTDAIKANGVVVIPQNAAVIGSITLAQEKRSMGRTGKLDFSIEKVRAADGEYVPLRYTMHKREGGSKGVSTGVITAGVAVLFWPAAPFILLRKGKDVTLNRGMTFEVFTDQDHIFQASGLQSAAPSPVPMQPTPHAQSAPAPAPQLQYAAQSAAAPAAPVGGMANLASLNITSSVEGAEVEIDGAFVGSTPAKTRVAPGVHKVTVRHGAQVWSRDLTVQPGADVNVNAILKK